MYVSFPQTLTVSGNFTHGRYGEVDLTVPGRLFNPTAVLPPGPARSGRRFAAHRRL
jgi:predicted extracellular nuclease